MMFWEGILCSCCYRSTLKHNSFPRVLLSVFFPFQNNVFKGLFWEYHRNVKIIPRYVRSDLRYKFLAIVINIRHQHAKELGWRC